MDACRYGSSERGKTRTARAGLSSGSAPTSKPRSPQAFLLLGGVAERAAPVGLHLHFDQPVDPERSPASDRHG